MQYLTHCTLKLSEPPFVAKPPSGTSFSVCRGSKRMYAYRSTSCNRAGRAANISHVPSEVLASSTRMRREEGRTASESVSRRDGFILLTGLGAIGWPASTSHMSLSCMSLAKGVLSRSSGSPSEMDPSESALAGGVPSGNDANPADVVAGGYAGNRLLVAADETCACSDGPERGDICGGVSGSCREELWVEGECDCAAVSAASMSSMAPVRRPCRMSSNPCSRRRVSSRSNALCNSFGSSPTVITAPTHQPTRVTGLPCNPPKRSRKCSAVDMMQDTGHTVGPTNHKSLHRRGFYTASRCGHSPLTMSGSSSAPAPPTATSRAVPFWRDAMRPSAFTAA